MGTNKIKKLRGKDILLLPTQRGTWLAQPVEHVTLYLRVVGSSPMLGVEPTLKKHKL